MGHWILKVQGLLNGQTSEHISIYEPRVRQERSPGGVMDYMDLWLGGKAEAVARGLDGSRPGASAQEEQRASAQKSQFTSHGHSLPGRCIGWSSRDEILGQCSAASNPM